MALRSFFFALLCVICIGPALGQGGPTAFDQHVLAVVPLATGLRAADITLSPDGSRAWLCSDYPAEAVFSLDAHSGRFTGAFGGLFSPSFIWYHPAEGRLYVVDEMPHGEGRGAVVRVFNPDSGALERSIPAQDWRCYRIGSAAFSPDAGWLWLASSPTDSSLYGHVPAALFRVDLKEGTWEQLAGLPPDRGEAMGTGRHYRGLCLAADAAGRLFVGGLHGDAVSVFPPGAKEPGEEVQLAFPPLRLCMAGGGELLAAGEGELAVIDTGRLQVVWTVEFEGKPSAVCVDSTGRQAYVAIHKSDRILVLDAATATLSAPPWDLAGDPAGRAVGVWRVMDDPCAAIVDLDMDQVRYYRKAEDMPPEWQDLPQRVRRFGSYGAKTGAGIRRDDTGVALRLTTGQDVTFELPRWLGHVRAVAVGPDEQSAYLLTQNSGAWLVKLRLTLPEGHP